MYSISSERPLPAVTLHILNEVDRIAQAHGVSYFVIGATARDIMLNHVFGLEGGRATRDVDFALAVRDWPLFETIRHELSARDGFALSSGASHRIHYKSRGGETGLVDLVPFGGVEQWPGTIAWPPDMSVLMNVAGYQEALGAAVQVAVSPGLVVRVASIPSLVILKLFAWRDRGNENPKDADDLRFLMHNYAAAGNMDRLYDGEFALLDAAGHDPHLAGITLLGKDVATLAGTAIRGQCVALLESPVQRDRLAVQMARASGHIDDALDHADRMLAYFAQGLALCRPGNAAER
jgi:predicted nucleotidyltransferase